jgi:hypothetical protein
MSKENKRFQVSVDVDSAMISSAPGSGMSRVILSNLDDKAMRQIARSIVHANLASEFRDALAAEQCAEPVKREMYTLFLGLDKPHSGDLSKDLETVLSDLSPSFTISEADGHFRGVKEHTLLIHLAVTDPETAYHCAGRLKELYGQEAVGLTRTGAYQRVVSSDFE